MEGGGGGGGGREELVIVKFVLCGACGPRPFSSWDRNKKRKSLGAPPGVPALGPGQLDFC